MGRVLDDRWISGGFFLRRFGVAEGDLALWVRLA
jgi:hypothetical protein